MQLISDHISLSFPDTIHIPGELRIMTDEGAYTGAMDICVSGGIVLARRDIDIEWVKVPTRDDVTIDEVFYQIDQWFSDGIPRDVDGRVIPLEL